MNKKVLGIESKAMDTLQKYNWPGNVRELENAIERAMVIGKNENITLADLSFQFDNFNSMPESETIADVERMHILKILKSTDWNISRSADILKIDRVTLYNKIKKYQLKKQIHV